MRIFAFACLVPFLTSTATPAVHLTREDKVAEEIQHLLDRGTELLDSAKPKESLAPLQLALAKSEKAFGGDHEQTASCLTRLGNAYLALADYRMAEPLYQRGLRIREAKLGKDHLDVASSLNNLAMLYSASGQFAKAEPLFQRSLQIKEVKLGKDDPGVAMSLNNLGRLYSRMGQYAKAEPLYLRGLQIREATLDKDDLDVGNSLHTLAMLYSDMGLNAKAEPYFRRCLAIREAKLGEGHPTVARTLHGLAGLYKHGKQYAKAEPLYQRGLRILEARLGKDHPDVATALNNLGSLYLDMVQYAKAEPLYLRSLQIKEARLGKDHPHVCSPLNNLAVLYEKAGQFAKAEPLFDRCLAIQEAHLPRDHPALISTRFSRAILHELHGRTAEAARLVDRARRSSRRHASLVLPFLPPPEQATFLAYSERKDLALALSLAASRRETAALTVRSAEWLLNAKAIAEEALARSALLARDSRDPATAKLATDLREARATLASLSVASPPVGQEKAHRQRTEELRSREQELSRRLALASGNPTGAAPWHDLAAFREQLPADAAFVDIARFAYYDFKGPVGKRWQSDRYAAWVTKRVGDPCLVELGNAAAIDAAILQVRQAVEASAKLIRAKGEAEAEAGLRRPLQVLSNLVLKPLLPHVGKAKRWVVSPDGNLWLVPWEMLLLPDGKYAIERHALSYVVSGRDLVQPRVVKAEPGPPLVVADPDFDLAAKAVRAGGQPSNRKGDDETRGLSSQLRLGRIPRLLGTRAEAKAIEKPLADYTKQPLQHYLGTDAGEGVVKAVMKPRVLVLATHGFFLPTERVVPSDLHGEKAPPLPGWENPLLRCGLLLAGCNDAAKEGDDGVLTGLEVVGMDLRGCELVVLSACETGLGDVQNSEGVAGLRQAFRLAGAESVVSTLWQVPDRASAQLMALFFQGLAKGKDRPTALREAQRKVIEERREDTGAAHPFFWAAFTLTGLSGPAIDSFIDR